MSRIQRQVEGVEVTFTAKPIPRLPRRTSLAVGIAVGALVASAVPAFAAWFVSGQGSGGAQLASLKGVKVDVKTQEYVLPGQEVTLSAVLESDNQIDLDVTKVTVAALESDGAAACTSGVRFTMNTGLVVHPGKNEVKLGTWSYPKKLPNVCQGVTLKAEYNVTTAYGTEGP